MNGNSGESDEFVVAGFVRCNSENIVPQEILNMIVSWYSIEFVYLMEKKGKGKLWRINVDEILYPAVNGC